MGLTRVEAKILAVLKQKLSWTVTNLSETVKIPRTTVHFLLNKLQKRSFAEKIKIKNHQEWKFSGDTNLSAKLRKWLSHLEIQSEILGGAETAGLGVEIYKGKRKIEEAYKKILSVGQSNRVYALQGSKSAQIILKKISGEYLFDFHKKFKSKGIIMEGVMGESSLNLFQQLSLEELKSHLDRMIIVHILPDEFINFDVDIIMFENTSLFINPSDEFVILIKNETINKAIKSWLLLAQEYSKKINLNEHLQNLINNYRP